MIYIFLFVLDMFLKKIVLIYFKENSSKMIDLKFLKIFLVKNKGIALNFLNDKKQLIIALNIIVLLLVFYEMSYSVNKISYLLILTGGFGNLFDRILRGHVIDYFSIIKENGVYFNLSDFYIIIGVILECIKYFN